LNYNPQILHFSGHGSEKNSLIFKSENTGEIEEVPPSALSEVFRVLGKNIDLVFLDACYTESQARAIAKHVNCVIGMSDAIPEITATEFASTFYSSLGFGKNIQDAFDLALGQLGLLSLPGDKIPKLIVKEGIDASKIFMTANKLQIPMSNPDSSNNSEDKGFRAENVSGNVIYNAVKGDHNVITVSVGENIKTDNKVISKLDPAFSKSITEFRDLLKEKLKDKQATEEQIEELNKNIDKLAKELEGVKADQTIEDEDKKDDIRTKLTNLAEAVVDIAPDVAEYVASVTQLAPVSKAIGRGIGYVSEQIKRKLLKK